MLLIATDEAGYGPKLGPLVIVATAWRIPDPERSPETLDCCFAPLRTACQVGPCRVLVGDSKAVYKPGAGLAMLHAVFSAGHHWCGHPERTLAEILRRTAAADLDAIQQTPWLAGLSEQPLLEATETGELLQQWRSAGVELVDIQSRVVTAARFNQACSNGGNKADLLSETTLGLVRQIVDARGQRDAPILVYCDRHGGRRYYGSVLQHVFAESQLRIVAEAPQQSQYQMQSDRYTMEVRFTVKGDSFAPVAMSSMHAKYWRERFMESFNGYFAARHRDPSSLRPTAGYPSDADRFLAQIQSLLAPHRITPDQLIRSR